VGSWAFEVGPLSCEGKLLPSKAASWSSVVGPWSSEVVPWSFVAASCSVEVDP
jgi:hypothetical protein